MEERIENELDNLGLQPKDRGRYWHIHCPTHDDRNKSAVCFKDGWICCFAGCPRIHINGLLKQDIVPRDYVSDTRRDERTDGRTCDFTDFWIQFEPLEDSVKGVPAAVLNSRGWRKFPGGWGYPPGVFIPYFDVEREHVRFFQIRHDEGSNRRFSFARNCRPITYGLEQLRGCARYLVFTEGSRDSVILGMAGVPAVALPSASSQRNLQKMEEYAKLHGLTLVAASDRDSAGDKLLRALRHPYIDARPNVGKDVGDMYEQGGLKLIKEYYDKYRNN